MRRTRSLIGTAARTAVITGAAKAVLGKGNQAAPPAAPAEAGSRCSRVSTLVMPVLEISSWLTTVAGPTPLMSTRLMRLPVTMTSSTSLAA